MDRCCWAGANLIADGHVGHRFLAAERGGLVDAEHPAAARGIGRSCSARDGELDVGDKQKSQPSASRRSSRCTATAHGVLTPQLPPPQAPCHPTHPAGARGYGTGFGNQSSAGGGGGEGAPESALRPAPRSGREEEKDEVESWGGGATTG